MLSSCCTGEGCQHVTYVSDYAATVALGGYEVLVLLGVGLVATRGLAVLEDRPAGLCTAQRSADRLEFDLSVFM